MKNLLNKNTKNRAIRDTGIEALRLVAIFMIIASHSVPFYGNEDSAFFINLNNATVNISHFVMIIIKYLGQIGNCMFMVISAYFLLDSKVVKKEKALMLITDSLFISVIILLITIFCTDIKISSDEFIKQFFPITYQGCWFVGCYLFLYLIHPILNKIIYGYNKKQILRISMFMFVFYSILSTFIRGEGYFYNFLIAFIMIYFVVAYLKLYLSKMSSKISINLGAVGIGILGIVGLILTTNILGLHFESMRDKMLRWNIFSNPFIILLSIGMFNLFRRWKFKNLFINSMASLTLYVYMIHENPIIRENFKPIFFEKSFYSISLISVVILIIFTILLCFPISWLYKEIIQKWVKKIAIYIWNIIKHNYQIFENKILKIE